MYNPLYAPIPKNATLRRYAVHGGLQMTHSTLTLVDAPFPRGLHLSLRWRYISRLQFKAEDTHFHAELIPAHSPLIRAYNLASYPPPTYTLNLRGLADLISCIGKGALGTRQHGHAQRHDNT
eukprot:9474233-Pyramimonas_sp.AAC.3